MTYHKYKKNDLERKVTGANPERPQEHQFGEQEVKESSGAEGGHRGGHRQGQGQSGKRQR